MNDKPRSLSILTVSLIVALSVALACVSYQNSLLSGSNKTLNASLESLREKSKQLEVKNRKLTAVIAHNQKFLRNMEKQKKQFKEAAEAVKKENEVIRYEIKKAQTQMNSALEERAYLEDMLIHKVREIQLLKSQSPAGAAQVAAEDAAAQSSDINEKIRQKDEQIRQLVGQNRSLSEKMDRLYQVATSQIPENSPGRIVLDDSATPQQISDEWNTVNLGSINVEKRSGGAPDSQTRTGPKTAGRVLAINDDHGFVVVDLGKVDNLSVKARLAVSREGKYIGDLSILEIRDIMTACNIKNLEEGEKIQVNDSVELQS